MKFLCTAAAFSVAALVGGTASAQNVGIATSNPGSLFHNIGTAVANAANANGLNTTIQPATSPNQFIPFVNDGGIEFGVANLQEVNYSITGEAWWNGKKNENIRVVGHLQPLVEAIFVRKDSDIMTGWRPAWQSHDRWIHSTEYDPAATLCILCHSRHDTR